MAISLVAGSVVQLKSDDKKMTVVKEGPAVGTVLCEWIGSTGRVERSAFPEDSLTAAVRGTAVPASRAREDRTRTGDLRRAITAL